MEFRRDIAPSSRGDVRRAMGLEEGLDAFGTYFITFAKDVNYGTLFSLSLFPVRHETLFQSYSCPAYPLKCGVGCDEA
jgi:hypothetical protein